MIRFGIAFFAPGIKHGKMRGVMIELDQNFGMKPLAGSIDDICAPGDAIWDGRAYVMSDTWKIIAYCINKTEDLKADFVTV
jgi:hypothetical protein